MNARQTAAALNLAEFTILCSYLDGHYGEEARYFDVKAVKREDGLIKEVVVVLRYGTEVTINAAAIADSVPQKKEMSEAA